jgi:hypothetical protein
VSNDGRFASLVSSIVRTTSERNEPTPPRPWRIVAKTSASGVAKIAWSWDRYPLISEICRDSRSTSRPSRSRYALLRSLRLRYPPACIFAIRSAW